MIIGTVHSIFTANNDWQYFDVVLKKNKEIWTENQYQVEWSFKIANETLDKIVRKEIVTANTPKNEKHLKTTKNLNNIELKPMS